MAILAVCGSMHVKSMMSCLSNGCCGTEIKSSNVCRYCFAVGASILAKHTVCSRMVHIRGESESNSSACTRDDIVHRTAVQRHERCKECWDRVMIALP